MRWLQRLGGLGLLLIAVLASAAQAQVRVGYWLDDSRQASVETVRALPPQAFTLFDPARPPSAPAYSVVWLRLLLDPQGPTAPHWVLDFRNRRIPDLQVFVQEQVQPLYIAGFRHPTPEAALAHRYLALPVPPDATLQPVLIRLELLSRGDLSVRAQPEPQFQDDWLHEHTVQAAYFGLAVGLLTFNALLGLALRDRVYGVYVAGGLCMVLNIAVTSGMGRLYVWHFAPWWEQFGNIVSAQLALLLLTQFIVRVLELPVHAPRLARLLDIVAKLQLPAMAALVVLGEAAYQTVMVGIALSSTLYFPSLGYCIWRRIPGAHLVLLAFLALLLGTLSNVLWTLQQFPDTVFARNGSQIGSALEMLLLAFLLADRFARLQQAKLAAQAEAQQAHAEALQAERARVEALRQSERLLETRVADRTAELEKTLTHLQQTQENLIQAEKLSALGAMVAGVSHELNTPVGIIVTASSTLGEASSSLQADFAAGKLTRTQAHAALNALGEGAALIHRSAQRASELVQSFKQVAVDQVTERKRQFDLRQVIEENLMALRASLKCEPWPVANEVPEGIDCDSYPGPLGQILSNLVLNAIHHGFADRPLGNIRIGAQTDTRHVELWVRDDGHGMDARTLSRVFEPFFTTRLGKGGSGLGLSVSHRMATTLLQGDLYVHSEPGQGSTFTLRFQRHATLA